MDCGPWFVAGLISKSMADKSVVVCYYLVSENLFGAPKTYYQQLVNIRVWLVGQWTGFGDNDYDDDVVDDDDELFLRELWTDERR